MTIALVFNIVLATLVVIGIVGMLAWSIGSQSIDAPTGLVPIARRRRRTTARAQFLGRMAGNRA